MTCERTDLGATASLRHERRGYAVDKGGEWRAAFVAALAVVKAFLTFVGRSGFAPFAYYRIALGLAVFGLISAGWL